MESLEKKIGYRFKNHKLLVQALTHSSCSNERHDRESYERLEFLGDSILGFVTAEFLYRTCPDMPEGRMTKIRAELVCESSLHSIAKTLDLGDYMFLGKGEEKGGGRNRISVMADMVESIIAAIFLDSGLDEAKSFIYRMLLDKADVEKLDKTTDYKSALQELLQKDGAVSIKYFELAEEGPDHDKTFTFGVSVNDKVLGSGNGKTKKEAEQAAACCALEELNK